MPCCLFPAMGDNCDADRSAIGMSGDRIDGHGDAVDGERSFGGDKADQRRWNMEIDLTGSACDSGVMDGCDGADPIDMTADDMAAEAIADAQREFEIEAIALARLSEGRSGEGFGGEGRGKSAGIGMFCERLDGKADSGAGDRIAGGDIAIGMAKGERSRRLSIGDGDNVADSGYNACKHDRSW